jgi:hypothetical protein
MTDMLAHARCGHCNEPQTIADIQIVGVRRPEDFEAFHAEPVFVMVMSCTACGQWTNHAMRRPGGDATDAIVKFIVLIKQECQGKKPALPLPGLGKKRSDASEEMPPQSREHSPLRPSIRDDHPVTPPTQREIQLFLNRLRKTSFRRRSKGFSNWLKDLGGNGNRGDDLGQSDPHST